MIVIKLTEEMAQALSVALVDRMVCVLATASKDGYPDVGYKGSVMVYDDEHLKYWERTRRQHRANVQENPHVAVLYNNGPPRLSWRFFGDATVHSGDDVWHRVMDNCVPAELDRDPERVGYAVLIRVEKVLSRGQVVTAPECCSQGEAFAATPFLPDSPSSECFAPTLPTPTRRPAG